MPLYEYECDACGHRFEAIQKFSDPPLDRCPKCGGTLHKLQSAPAFQFKGSGWYITDYARKGQGPEAKAESSDGDSAAKDKTGTAEKTEKAESGTSGDAPAAAPASSPSAPTTGDSKESKSAKER
jgi:putative FmdB family regulatory protein